VSDHFNFDVYLTKHGGAWSYGTGTISGIMKKKMGGKTDLQYANVAAPRIRCQIQSLDYCETKNLL